MKSHVHVQFQTTFQYLLVKRSCTIQECTAKRLVRNHLVLTCLRTIGFPCCHIGGLFPLWILFH